MPTVCSRRTETLGWNSHISDQQGKWGRSSVICSSLNERGSWWWDSRNHDWRQTSRLLAGWGKATVGFRWNCLFRPFKGGPVPVSTTPFSHHGHLLPESARTVGPPALPTRAPSLDCIYGTCPYKSASSIITLLPLPPPQASLVFSFCWRIRVDPIIPLPRKSYVIRLSFQCFIRFCLSIYPNCFFLFNRGALELRTSDAELPTEATPIALNECELMEKRQMFSNYVFSSPNI